MIASSTARLLHRVDVTHAATGQPLEVAEASLTGAPHGWFVRIRAGAVAVVDRERTPAPRAGVAPDPTAPPAPAPTLTIRLADGPGHPRMADRTADIPLTAAAAAHSATPAPAVLEVELVTPSTGAPAAGRTVTARATQGPTPRPTHSLAEVRPGVYRSGVVTWTSAFTPMDLIVGADLLRQVRVDVTRTTTRIRLVDTT